MESQGAVAAFSSQRLENVKTPFQKAHWSYEEPNCNGTVLVNMVINLRLSESLCYGIWSNLVDQVQRTLERGASEIELFFPFPSFGDIAFPLLFSGQSSDHGDVFLALLSVTQDIVDNEYVFPAMALVSELPWFSSHKVSLVWSFVFVVGV